jgi:hypothetical protein
MVTAKPDAFSGYPDAEHRRRFPKRLMDMFTNGGAYGSTDAHNEVQVCQFQNPHNGKNVSDS